MTRPLRTALIVIGIGVALVAGFIAFELFAPVSAVHFLKIRHGNEIVRKIEDFQRRQRRLPNSLDEVGVSDDDLNRYQYERCSSSEYILFFRWTLGESMTWNSAKAKWLDVGGGCTTRTAESAP